MMVDGDLNKCQGRLEKKKRIAFLKHENDDLRALITEVKKHMTKMNSTSLEDFMTKESANDVNTDSDEKEIIKEELQLEKYMEELLELQKENCNLKRLERDLYPQILAEKSLKNRLAVLEKDIKEQAHYNEGIHKHIQAQRRSTMQMTLEYSDINGEGKTSTDKSNDNSPKKKNIGDFRETRYEIMSHAKEKVRNLREECRILHQESKEIQSRVENKRRAWLEHSKLYKMLKEEEKRKEFQPTDEEKFHSNFSNIVAKEKFEDDMIKSIYFEEKKKNIEIQRLNKELNSLRAQLNWSSSEMINQKQILNDTFHALNEKKRSLNKLLKEQKYDSDMYEAEKELLILRIKRESEKRSLKDTSSNKKAHKQTYTSKTTHHRNHLNISSSLSPYRTSEYGERNKRKPSFKI